MTKEQLYVEQRCTRMLLEIGIPANLQGFKFLRSAVMCVVENPEIISSVTKKLYPCIANMYEVAPAVIERSIRHSIDVAFARRGITGLNDLLDLDIFDFRYKPSNSELIALLAEKIIGELKEMLLNNSDNDDNNPDNDDKNHKK